MLGLGTLSNLGIHAILTGGLSLQTKESWKGFVGKEIPYQGNDVEVYFEEDDFDQFLKKFDSIKTAQYVHPVMEHAWGKESCAFMIPIITS